MEMNERPNHTEMREMAREVAREMTKPQMVAHLDELLAAAKAHSPEMHQEVLPFHAAVARKSSMSKGDVALRVVWSRVAVESGEAKLTGEQAAALKLFGGAGRAL